MTCKNYKIQIWCRPVIMDYGDPYKKEDFSQRHPIKHAGIAKILQEKLTPISTKSISI